MTLSSAIARFEAKFNKVCVINGPDDHKSRLICSGGEAPHDGTMPALYSSKDHAVSSWYDFASSQVPYEHDILEWISRPELLEFQITMANRKQQHRLVSNRFAVKSQFKTEKSKNG